MLPLMQEVLFAGAFSIQKTGLCFERAGIPVESVFIIACR